MFVPVILHFTSPITIKAGAAILAGISTAAATYGIYRHCRKKQNPEEKTTIQPQPRTNIIR